MTPNETRQFTAALRWAADRIDSELANFPYHGRATRAAWAVRRLRTYANDAENAEDTG
jgi:hypothetical protein